MSDKLDLILSELQNIRSEQQRHSYLINQLEGELQSLNSKVNTLESGQKELHQITRAIYDRQEETDAKLEALTVDRKSVV